MSHAYVTWLMYVYVRSMCIFLSGWYIFICKFQKHIRTYNKHTNIWWISVNVNIRIACGMANVHVTWLNSLAIHLWISCVKIWRIHTSICINMYQIDNVFVCVRTFSGGSFRGRTFGSLFYFSRQILQFSYVRNIVYTDVGRDLFVKVYGSICIYQSICIFPSNIKSIYILYV